MKNLTEILSKVEKGDAAASSEVLPLVYQELRKLARSKLADELPGQSIEATGLVHEAYLRLVGSDQTWEGRRHFFAAAAESMRRILIERARKRKRVKHGGDYQRIDLDVEDLQAETSDEEMLVVSDLLDQLAKQHPEEAEIAKLHYFGGFSIRECAKALELSSSTAHVRWRVARAWLVAEIADRNSSES